MADLPTLKLVRESKICELMSCDKPTKRWEASGVLVKDGHYLVVFDDRTETARIGADLEPAESNGLFGMSAEVAPNCRTLHVLRLAAKLSGQGVTHEEEGKSQEASGCAADVQ